MNEQSTCNLSKCLDTHYVEDKNKSVTCEKGVWKGELKCLPKSATCNGEPANIKNGKIKCEQISKDAGTGHYLGGTTCIVSCNEGYIEKDKQIQCVVDNKNKAVGKWEPASCLRLEYCRGLPNITNGKVSCIESSKVRDIDGYFVNSDCRVSCVSGYSMEGIVQCNEDPKSETKGTWIVGECGKY